jgi:N-glycosylase/DNA lyase
MEENIYSLLEKYGGDPRNITAQPLTIKEIKEKLVDFPYLRGSKLANFYIRVMGETGLFKIKDLNELDIPVDKQVTRFTIYTGVLKLKGGKFQGCANDDPLRSVIQEAWRNAARSIGAAPWKLDEPMWNIGSKLCVKRKCGQCPVKGYCDKIKGITFKENLVVWEPGD